MSTKLDRSCIVCGSPECTDVFSFTHDFMVNVRSAPAEKMVRNGLGAGESSTIVKCGSCGCNYIKDVLVTYQLASERESRNDRETSHNKDVRDAFASVRSAPNFEKYSRLAKIFDLLVRSLGISKPKSLSVLDFGAGSAAFSRVAAVLGGDTVVAYDLGYDANIQDVFDAVCPPGITATNDPDKTVQEGPYDIIFCQSMIEHVSDPAGVLRSLHSLLREGGRLYINNPIMDLDREIGALRSATKIEKKDRLSYYHPGHLNYMMPRHFVRLYKKAGFRALRIYAEPLMCKPDTSILKVLLLLGLHNLKRLVVYLSPNKSRSLYVLTK